MQAKSPLMIAVVAGLLLVHASDGVAKAQAASAPVAATEPAAKPGADPGMPVEAQVRQMLADNRLAQAEMVDLRRRLTAAELAGRWLPWLILGLVAALVACGWLGLRVRRLRREKSRRDWAYAQADPQLARAADPVASGSAPLLSPDQPLLSGAGATPSAMAAKAGASGPAAAGAKSTLDAAPGAGGAAVAPKAASAEVDAARLQNTITLRTGTPPRPVSVEELLDLEQQVDFFMVLGQEQAAIDLLLGHVRATGGINALPYFKLLEIYRQQGDEEAFERTRERFNQRFNATAPDWSGNLAAGRHLTDYPDVILRLQRAWPHPLRALAELDGMLLRRADLEPFDLPAFHDILTLQALVRDLPNGAGFGASAVPAHNPEPALPAGRGVAPVDWRSAPVGVTTMTVATAAGPGAAQEAERTLALATAAAGVDLLLPLDADPMEVTEPRPRMSEPGAARAMLADWMLARSTMQAADLPADTNPGRVNDTARKPVKLDLDLSDFAPAPREFTRPAAFTDLDMRRDSRLSDFSAFEDSDMLPPAANRR